MNLKEVLSEYNKTRTAWHYPRKRLIRLNGGKCLPEKEAKKEMEFILKMDKVERDVKWARESGWLSNQIKNGLA